MTLDLGVTTYVVAVVERSTRNPRVTGSNPTWVPAPLTVCVLEQDYKYAIAAQVDNVNSSLNT